MSVLNDPRVTPDTDGGYDVTCCPGLDPAPTCRVVQWVDGQWEAFYLTGPPQRTFFNSAEDAVSHLLGGTE